MMNQVVKRLNQGVRSLPSRKRRKTRRKRYSNSNIRERNILQRTKLMGFFMQMWTMTSGMK